MTYVRPTPEKVAELREKWWEFRWKKRMRDAYLDLVRGHNLLFEFLKNSGRLK